MLEAELDEALGRSRSGSAPEPAIRRIRRKSLVTVKAIGRAPAGNLRPSQGRGAARPAEHSRRQDHLVEKRMLRAYQRRTLAADLLIAGCYLAGTNTRRVRRALGAVFAGAVGKDNGEPGLAQGKERLGRVEWAFGIDAMHQCLEPLSIVHKSGDVPSRPRQVCDKAAPLPRNLPPSAAASRRPRARS